jgi:hypothetical protein
MKRSLCILALSVLVTALAYGQQPAAGQGSTVQPSAQNPSAGSQNQQQQPQATSSSAQSQNGFNSNSNGLAGQLPQTGRDPSTANQSQTAQGQATARAGVAGSVQLRVGAITASDQPIATQVQQVLTAEPVLVQTLPMLQIHVDNGALILDGSVQCGAERVLIETLCRDRLPRTVRIENRLRPPGGAFSPAGLR